MDGCLGLESDEVPSSGPCRFLLKCNLTHRLKGTVLRWHGFTVWAVYIVCSCLLPYRFPRPVFRPQTGLKSDISRLYGGIHDAFDNDHGFRMGQAIGMGVTAFSWRRIT